ncbi:hypothetical protein N752_08020 [Desulforamulus aquiferis]|nr:hypothetical protein N752_08020 [Desulforamulus aquiferis]
MKNAYDRDGISFIPTSWQCIISNCQKVILSREKGEELW